jgi:hypothetical protein
MRSAWGLFLRPRLIQRKQERREPGLTVTLHGVVFDIFVLALPCTESELARRTAEAWYLRRKQAISRPRD